jgi:putative peptidoglycan lipid II flippase
MTGPLTIPTERKGNASRSSAFAVSAGILLSRLIGLVRERVFAHYFGNSDAADAFRAAFRIPNFLQNLFGEGVLSASFIPVYARLRAEERHEEATQLAEAILAILFLLTSILTVAGIFATPWLMNVIAPTWQGEKRLLTIHLVQILFPGAALLVISAWCLGILNSHRKFFLSYTAPVIWNVAIITAMLWKGGHVGESRLAVVIAIASVIGSGLQFAVQVPTVMSFLRPLYLKPTLSTEHVRTVVRNFFPVFLSRGVVQISAYVDSLLATLLPTGAVSALAYAQTLNTLPVSLFGMAISAAELPAMSSALGTADEIAIALRRRLENGLKNISFFVVPSAVGFVILGDVIVATIYRSGNFKTTDVTFVWSVLAGSGVGLLATTSGRLYSSAFYALRDTRTPLNFAIIRVVLTVVLGYLFALPLPRLLGIDRHWGVAGLTLSAGLAGWVEFALLRRALQARIGHVVASVSRIARLWAGALLSAAFGYSIKLMLPFHAPHAAWITVVIGLFVLSVFGISYLVSTRLLGVEAPGSLTRLLRRRSA